MLFLARSARQLANVSRPPTCLRSISSTFCRAYALSRFEERSPGSSRKRWRPTDWPPRPGSVADLTGGASEEERSSFEESPLWEAASNRAPVSDPEAGLRRLLLTNESLVITRQMEMLNIFVGFEQSNKYVISTDEGVPLGFVAEEPRGFLASFSRQILRTHRPFHALLMDADGNPVLWLRRPFQFINSRMYVQRLKNFRDYTLDGEPLLDTFGEVQQRWHPWRRRYDLFLREQSARILSTTSEPQPEPDEDLFKQLAKVDEGFLAWDFRLRDARGEEMASVRRAFRGFGRELFTDTGQYFVRFGPMPPDPYDLSPRAPTVERTLTLDERALVLAMAVNIDFDYFSRHSEHGTGIPMFWFFGGGEE